MTETAGLTATGVDNDRETDSGTVEQRQRWTETEAWTETESWTETERWKIGRAHV